MADLGADKYWRDPFTALCSQPELVEFVRGLGLPAEVEERLAAMTPATYVGLAPELVDHLD